MSHPLLDTAVPLLRLKDDRGKGKKHNKHKRAEKEARTASVMLARFFEPDLCERTASVLRDADEPNAADAVERASKDKACVFL